MLFFALELFLYLRIYNNKKVTSVQDLFSAAAVGEPGPFSSLQFCIFFFVFENIQKRHFFGIARDIKKNDLHFQNATKKDKTQFEIECRCGGHSVTKKFKTILQILLAKPKLWKNLWFYK